MPWCCFTATAIEPIQKLPIKVDAPLLVEVPVAVKGPIVMIDMPPAPVPDAAAIEAEVAAVRTAVEAVEAAIIANKQTQLDNNERDTCAVETIFYTLALYLMMTSIYIFIQPPTQNNLLYLGPSDTL
jgi:hypothetical protein